MKKIIGILTALLITVTALSCVVPVFAADTAETAEENVLVAGNINDVEFGAFSIRLEGDSIKIYPNKFEYYTDYGGYVESGFYMDIATNDKLSIKSNSAFYRSSADNMCFTPESNGKYIVVICEFFSDYYTTFVSLDFYYIVPIICHDNIVDIDTDNIYTLCNGESNAHIVKTNKRIFRYQGGNYPIGIVLPKDKTIYSFKKFNDSWIEMDRLPVLVLSCFFEDHFFYNNELILLGKDKEGEFYAEYNSSFIAKYAGILEERFGSIQAAFEKDLTAEGIDSINGMKPASRIFCAYPGYIKENTVFLQDSSGITKYHIDTVAVKNTDYDGEDDEYFRFLPETFTSLKIPENDINYDGRFNVADAVVLQKWLHGLGGMNMVNTKLADVCKDEVIDVFDMCVLKKKLLAASP